MGFLKPPKVDVQAPEAPAVPPVQMQASKKPAKKPMTPTFLGSEATPEGVGSPSLGGGKTLLGQ